MFNVDTKSKRQRKYYNIQSVTSILYAAVVINITLSAKILLLYREDYQSLRPSSTSMSSSSSNNFSSRACCSSLFFFCQYLKRKNDNRPAAAIPSRTNKTVWPVWPFDSSLLPSLDGSSASPANIVDTFQWSKILTVDWGIWISEVVYSSYVCPKLWTNVRALKNKTMQYSSIIFSTEKKQPSWEEPRPHFSFFG